MNKNHKRTFINSAFIQYDYILGNEEIRRTVADFLLHYVSLEAYYKKLLRAEKEKSGERLTAKEIRNLKVDTREMKRVFRYFDISVEEKLLDCVFGSDDSNYMDCSIKKLRDRLVHNVNEQVIRVILERHDQMEQDMNAVQKCFLQSKD